MKPHSTPVCAAAHCLSEEMISLWVLWCRGSFVLFAQVLNLSFLGLFPSEADLSDLGKTEWKLRNCHTSWWPKGVLVSYSRDILSFWMGKTNVPGEDISEGQLCEWWQVTFLRSHLKTRRQFLFEWQHPAKGWAVPACFHFGFFDSTAAQ